MYRGQRLNTVQEDVTRKPLKMVKNYQKQLLFKIFINVKKTSIFFSTLNGIFNWEELELLKISETESTIKKIDGLSHGEESWMHILLIF